MKQETTQPFGWQQWTTSNGYVVVAEAKSRSEQGSARVTLTDPTDLCVLSFEHHNPIGAAHELAVVIERSALEVPAA